MTTIRQIKVIVLRMGHWKKVCSFFFLATYLSYNAWNWEMSCIRKPPVSKHQNTKAEIYHHQSGRIYIRRKYKRNVFFFSFWFFLSLFLYIYILFQVPLNNHLIYILIKSNILLPDTAGETVLGERWNHKTQSI